MKKVFKTAAFLLAMGLMTSTFTSCGEDDGTEEGTVEEQMKFNNLTAKANADGTITIGGSITTNTKLKEFCLYAEDGTTVVYNFLESNKAVKEKNEVLDENGKASKEKQFTLNIESATVPVAIYKLAIKTKKNAAQAETVGEVLDYKIGASNSTTGSYLSIVNNEAFNFETAKTKACEVIAESSADGKTVTGLKRGSKANNAEVAGKAGKVALFQNNAAAETITAGGVIITESGCICKVNSIDNTADGDATVKAVTIKNGGSLKVDVSGFTFSK